MKANIVRIIVGIVLFPLSIWNLLMNRKNKMNPPGRIVETENSKVHIILTGEGSATVILEAGLGSISLDWFKVQPEITKVARVLSYDRGNSGWSKTKRQSLTALDYVQELKEVLEKSSLAPPYVLVGHSFGGLIMRLFASMYPKQVKGLLLIDAVHEDQYLPGNLNKKFKGLVTLAYITSITGIPRLLRKKAGRKFLEGESNKLLNYTGYTVGAYQTMYQEYINSSISAQQLKSSVPLEKELPVIVLSSNSSAKQWKEQQLKLARLTANTEHIQTNKGHSIHLEDSDVVTEAIFTLLEREATNHV